MVCLPDLIFLSRFISNQNHALKNFIQISYFFKGVIMILSKNLKKILFIGSFKILMQIEASSIPDSYLVFCFRIG